MADILPEEVLATLDRQSPILSSDAFPDIPSQDLKGALDRLASRYMITYTTSDIDETALLPEAKDIVENGSHEARVFEALRQAVEGLSMQELTEKVGKETATVGQRNAFKNKWISKGNAGKFVAAAENIQDGTREQLKVIQQTRTYSDPAVLKDLTKRKLVKAQKVTSFEISKGPKFALQIVKEETDLTADMIADGSWKTATFKPYNFAALGAQQMAGALHPLMKVRAEFRQIFFNMGFEEMSTANFVETGFWNFDALFVQQNHPARDLQDTFYTSDPVAGDKPRAQFEGDDRDYEQYWKDIKDVHEGKEIKFGSIGYRYPWTEEESLRLVLRTHTTAVSTAMLCKLASQKDANGRIPPARLFSVDRVFRNETVDATHLAEFHQVEGVIADYNLSLGALMEFMKDFFAAMGLHNLLFKPAFNPYTEPSMEIFSYHEGLGKLIEIGNSGMFRPEMLEPMGIDSTKMQIFGFGLSLERPTMLKYKRNNIRELLGHKVDLGFIQRNPAVRLDKD